MSKTTRFIAAAAMGGTLLAAAPAVAQSRWDWHGGFAGDRAYALIGPGVRDLLPELRRTNRGRAFVMRNFDWNHDGIVQRREADAANRAFLDAAGPRRDRFDWDAHDRIVAVPVAPPPPAPPIAWDRGAMHAYHMRQTRYGATFDIADVLFETDSARLRPGAIARLRPLAGYLRANPGVQLRIDGHTDSRASQAYNQRLSEARADSVDQALVAMGVRADRMRVYGHGETEPVATNTTAAGRQANRRVEVTLIGRRAADF